MAGLRNRSISDFKSQLIGGGARPNLFQVAIPTFPSTIAGLWKSGAGQEQQDFNFFAKATALPAQNIAAIDVPFRGRTFKVAGDRTIDNSTVTIINDELTRANFRNIVEPYLRDVQAKRGVYGFLVICDTTNNTPDVIDNNEFRADIFLKPTKSINYVTLTFVATRTGISFEEVAGRV